MTLTARLAERFRHAPGRWIDGRELATVGGLYAWRTRISELRRSPFNMRIENRQRIVDRAGAKFTISEYRFVPAPITRAAAPMLPLQMAD